MIENENQEALSKQKKFIPTWASELMVQRELNKFYLREISPPDRFEEFPLRQEYARAHAIEDAWNQEEMARIQHAPAFPQNSSDFKDWYNQVHTAHRQKVSGFFSWLAEQSTIDELAFYIAMEEQVDGRFDDVISLAQLGMVGDMKLALAENYWDEMGLGDLAEMHTSLFMESAMGIRALAKQNETAIEAPASALKNGNLLMMYALRRRFFPRLLGALAILEHTAPYRFKKTVQAMRRHKIPERLIYYHEMHIEVDANHGKQLFNRVLMPLASNNPTTIAEICRGCLIRFNVAVDYYNGVMTQIQKTKINNPAMA